MGIFSGSPFPPAVRDKISDLTSEFLNLREQDASRVSRMRTHRKELEASREREQLIPLTSQGEDYGRKHKSLDPTRHDLDLPLGQAITVKHTHRISGRLPDAVVDRRQENAQERYRSDTMEKMWWGWLRQSGESVLFQDGAWDGSQVGSACFEAYLDTDSQMPILRNVDPIGIYVVRGLSNPHDFERVYRHWSVPVSTLKAQYRGKFFGDVEIPVDDIDSTHKVGQIPMATIVQCRSREGMIRFVLGGDNGTKIDKALPLLELNDELGFCPYIVIPNIGPYRDVWGWSDYQFVRGLVRYIPQLISREADIIRAVANGAMIDKGTGEDPDVIRKILREGGIISSKKEGNLDPVEVPQVPPFEIDHAERVFRLLKWLGFTPDAAWGEGSAGSGSDRGLQLQPMLELTSLKQSNWSAGLSRLAGYAFRIVEKQQGGRAYYRGSRPGRAGQMAGFQPFAVGPDESPARVPNPSFDPNAPVADEPEMLQLPRSPKELFQGEYQMRFIWQNRIDPDDPAYVTNELNKFAQGAQSLRRTLEKLGVENPEDEIRVIEEEAQKHPWLRQGMIALAKIELDAAMRAQDQQAGGQSFQGEDGGAPTSAGAGLMRAALMMGSKDGRALDADATRASLPGDSVGEPYGGA